MTLKEWIKKYPLTHWSLGYYDGFRCRTPQPPAETDPDWTNYHKGYNAGADDHDFNVRANAQSN